MENMHAHLLNRMATLIAHYRHASLSLSMLISHRAVRSYKLIYNLFALINITVTS